MKIPETDSIRELAEFWDTHDLTEFGDQLEEVSEPVFARGRANAVTVPLSADEHKEIRKIAEARGAVHQQIPELTKPAEPLRGHLFLP